MDKFITKNTNTSEPSTSTNESFLKDNLSENVSSSFLFHGSAGSSLFDIFSHDTESKKLSAKCNTCFKVISGVSSSTGNFISHLMVSSIKII